VANPVAELRYEGTIDVRPYRRGTFLGKDHLELLIERTLGTRYSFGQGWHGHARVSIELYEREPGGEERTAREP